MSGTIKEALHWKNHVPRTNLGNILENRLKRNVLILCLEGKENLKFEESNE